MAKKDFGNNLGRSNNLSGGLKHLLGTSGQQEEPEKRPELSPEKEKTITTPKKTVPVEKPVEQNSIEKTVETKPEVVEKTKKEKEAFSRTFYIYESEFKTIEDFVRFKIMSGDIRFSQKNALTEALNLLKEVVRAGIKVDSPLRKENDSASNRSFLMLKTDFDFINEVLRIRRMEGQTKFTQANVLTEALNLLRKKYPNL